jgi:cytochrome c553
MARRVHGIPVINIVNAVKNSFIMLLLFATTAFALAQTPGRTAVPLLTPDNTIGKRVAACVACHKVEDQATRDGYFPRIAGKPAGYLANQLINFREGRRQYPLMTYMVSHLSDAYLLEMAEHFAAIRAPYPPPLAAAESAAVMARGRQLALEGDWQRDVPACIACHGARLTGIAPSLPGIVGLPRDYLNAQFGAWKNRTRQAARPDCMAGIVERLSAADVSAVSAWLSSQAMPADTRPEPALSARLPLRCGSVAGGGQ